MALLRVVDRDGVEHEVDAKPGLKVMETLRELDYGVAAICGGMCSCATCHVYVDPQWVSKLPAAMSDEKELLTELSHHESNSRLSCQIEFTNELMKLRDQPVAQTAAWREAAETLTLLMAPNPSPACVELTSASTLSMNHAEAQRGVTG